jgi:hypothetical protein
MRLDGDTFFVPTHFYNVLGTRDPALRVSDGAALTLPAPCELLFRPHQGDIWERKGPVFVVRKRTETGRLGFC